MDEVIIVGGGVSGLCAALHLAERGVPARVLEADPAFVGGRLRSGPPVTIEHAGRSWTFTGEHGVHGIWQPYVHLKATLARHGLLPEGLRQSPDEAWIHSDGLRVRRAAIGRAIHTSPVPAPFHYLHLFTRPRFVAMLTPADLLALPRVVGTLFVALAVDPIGEQLPLRGETLARFTRGWSPRLTSFFAGLARNALAAHPDEVPAAGFIAFLRFYTMPRRDAWAFSLLPGTGGACVSEPLAARARALGAQVRLGARVARLEREGEGWAAVVEGPAGEERLAARQVIMAVDAPAARRLLAASPPTAAGAEGLWFPRGVPTAIFRIWYDRKPRSPAPSGIFSGDFVVDNYFWMDEFQPEYAEWARATGGGAIEMHIYGPPELLDRPDAALLAQAITDAGRAFPGAGKVLHAELLRNDPAHTLFGVGAPGEHLGVETPWEGLFACGDWVANPAPALYLERATLTGILAANAVLRRRGLEPFPTLPYPAPEPLAALIGRGIGRLRRALHPQKRAASADDGR